MKRGLQRKTKRLGGSRGRQLTGTLIIGTLILGLSSAPTRAEPAAPPLATAAHEPAKPVSVPAARLETEYKLAVPAGQEAAVWHWLRCTYAATKPRQLGAGWESAQGVETFEDRYFDDDRRTLLAARAGLRHRRRFAADGTLKKQLVQLKTTDDAAGMLRQELKFKPLEGAAATAPLAELIQPADRPLLDSALAALGVRLPALTHEMGLDQRRRRLYLRLDGSDFATLTIDSSYHHSAPAATFTEIEVELNEKRYTGASGAERQQMQGVMDGIRADLLRQFPGLRQDQRPKYTKLTALLDGKTAAASRVAFSSSHQPASRHLPTWLFGGLGFLSALLVGKAVNKWRNRA